MKKLFEEERDNINLKINEIDRLLGNDDEFEKYILSIDNNLLDAPDNLNKKIYMAIKEEKIKEKVKLKLDDNIKNSNIVKDVDNTINDNDSVTTMKPPKSEHKYSVVDILKIACFSLVVMISWGCISNINVNNVSKIEIDSEKKDDDIFKIYGKFNEYTGKFSNLLLNPINFERGEE